MIQNWMLVSDSIVFLFFFSNIFLSKYFHQFPAIILTSNDTIKKWSKLLILYILWHEIGFFLWAIIYLWVLEEAEEEGVDGHLVDGEEAGGDEVGGGGDDQGGQQRVVQARDLDLRRHIRHRHSLNIRHILQCSLSTQRAWKERPFKKANIFANAWNMKIEVDVL